MVLGDDVWGFSVMVLFFFYCVISMRVLLTVNMYDFFEILKEIFMHPLFEREGFVVRGLVRVEEHRLSEVS